MIAKSFTQRNIKEMTMMGKICKDVPAGERVIHRICEYLFHFWEMKRLPSVSLVTMFKVSEKDITNYQPCDSSW